MNPGGQITGLHPLVLQQHQYSARAAVLEAAAPVAPGKKPKRQRHPIEDQPQVAEGVHRQQQHEAVATTVSTHHLPTVKGNQEL